MPGYNLPPGVSVSDIPGCGYDDEEEPLAPPIHCYTVAVYLVDQAYGGPEEGGWWYEYGELSSEHWKHTKVFPTKAGDEDQAEKEAYAYAQRLQAQLDAEDNAGRLSISSVNSIGWYRADVTTDIPPEHFPAERPRYE